MAENRGRPSEQSEVLEKYTQTCYEIPSKPELGWTSIWHYDKTKFANGPLKVEHSPPKGYKHPKVKPEKGKAYGKIPVVLVFKTSNRSNAKTKIKVFKNENIDYILTTSKLVGVSSTAEIIDIGVGESFIERYTQKYNLA
jgi:hypothetical protein